MSGPKLTRSARRRYESPTVSLLMPVALVAACGVGPGAAHEAREVRSTAGGTVVSGLALMDGQGSVLETLRGKVPGLHIRSDGGPCPRITLRNDASYQTQVNPLVYVDGTRTTDTCVLDSLQSRDVEMVEVYPRGVTTRPGYDTHAHGLILVFMRSSDEERPRR